MRDEKLLGDFLQEMGLLSRGQVAQALALAEEERAPLSRVLTARGFVDEDEMRRAYASWLGMPFVRLQGADIRADVLALIPEPLCRTYSCAAFALEGDTLEVALLDMEHFSALESLALPYTLRPRLTDTSSLRSALLRYQKILKEKFPLDVDGLLLRALASQASEVHLEAEAGGDFLVRYRAGPRLHDAYVLPAAVGALAIARLKALAKLLPDTATPQHGRFKILPVGATEEIGVTVATAASLGGEVLSLRLSPARAHGYSLEELGVHGEGLEDMHRVLSARSGLFVACGEGAGILLETLLAYTAHESRRLLAVDSGARLLPFATQLTHPPESSRAPSVRAALRQNPDVLLVSSVSDTETASLVVAAANRGVLVLAGVSANTAGGALVKLTEEYAIAPELLGTVLLGASHIEMVPRLCPTEPAVYRPLRPEITLLEEKGVDMVRVLQTLRHERIVGPGAGWKDVPFFAANACSACHDGYFGSVGLCTVMPVSMRVRELVREEASAESLEHAARAEGSLSLLEDALYKAACGLMDFKEVIALAEDSQNVV